MKKLTVLFSVMLLFVCLSSFKTKVNHLHRGVLTTLPGSKTTAWDQGYFYQHDQEYHVYTDGGPTGDVIAMYKTVAEGPDGAAITSFTGHGYIGSQESVYVNYTDVGSYFYNGITYF
jgi:hypothetical protein